MGEEGGERRWPTGWKKGAGNWVEVELVSRSRTAIFSSLLCAPFHHGSPFSFTFFHFLLPPSFLPPCFTFFSQGDGWRVAGGGRRRRRRSNVAGVVA